MRHGRREPGPWELYDLEINKDLDRVNSWAQAGELRCFLEDGYRLADIPAAVQRFGEAKHGGEIVISVREASNAD